MALRLSEWLGVVAESGRHVCIPAANGETALFVTPPKYSLLSREPKYPACPARTLALGSKRQEASAKMDKILRLGGVIEFALALSEAVWHPPGLPVGGSHASQMAACFGVAMIISELMDLFPALRLVSLAGTDRATREKEKPPVIWQSFGSERRSGQDRRGSGRGGRRATDFAA